MSSRQRKADLLVRVRYQNPLPPPPFPPKLVTVPTNVKRYANYEFLLPASQTRELPMVVDQELGMPLELGRDDDGYWIGDLTRVAPDPFMKPKLDEADLALLIDPPGSGSSLIAPQAVSGPKITLTPQTKKVAVTLPRTDSQILDTKPPLAELEPVTRESRMASISDTFIPTSLPLPTVVHPNYPHKRAVKSWSILPDDELATINYRLYRFGENPDERRSGMGEGVNSGYGPARLSFGLFRPIETEGDYRMAYYLLPEDREAARLKRRKFATVPTPTEAEHVYEYNFTRDYEISAKKELRSEYFMTLEEGEHRGRGAYYAPLKESIQLRKRRLQPGERPDDYGDEVQFWHQIQLRMENMGGEEVLAEEINETETVPLVNGEAIETI